MKSTLHILDTIDGDVRSQPYEWDDTDPRASEFLWSEGQNCCDCNRSLYFAWADGKNRDDSENHMAEDHDDNNFLVKITGPDGSVLYKDDCWPNE